MIRLFKRLRRIVGRRDGSRQTLQRPSSCTPISPLPSPLRLKGRQDDVQQAGAPRHMPPPAAGLRSRQIRKPHSPVHADRGFLHGWLCDAERHPKPFTLTVVQIVVTVARKRTGERRLNAVSNSRPIRPWPGVSSGEMPNTFCAGAPGRWLRYTLMTAAVTYMNATPVRKPDRTGGDSQDCLCRPLPRRKKAVTSTITWRIAPAPTPRARADHWVP